MAMVFEVGKMYGAWDTGTPAITIISRTNKTALVEDSDTGECWRMRIKSYDNGNEYMADGRVPAALRECYTYEARFVTKE